MSRILGRTNEPWPEMWLRLVPTPGWPETLRAATDSGLPIDVSLQTGLWGHGLVEHRGPLVAVGETDLSTLRPQSLGDALMAELIQLLSSLSGRRPELWFLRARNPLSEEQCRAAFEVLETARSDGAFRFLGLFAERSSDAALSVWALHDAFEVLMVPEYLPERGTLEDLARRRRVGVVTLGGSNGFRVVEVRSPQEVEAAMGEVG
ncbi:MAG: hypothetical protein N2109_10660 [Fimbriimonadales bacterium]|nr:hypothetical protein [Fimbriimonadales bacterium]